MTDTARATGALSELAEQAGIQEHWTDAGGHRQRVAPDTLRAILQALELPAGSPEQVRDSSERLKAQAGEPDCRHGAWLDCLRGDAPEAPLLVCDAAATVQVAAGGALPYRIDCEDGAVQQGRLEGSPGQWRFTAPARPGYHRLLVGERCTTLAVCPPRGPRMDALTPERAHRPWGIAVQIGSLRQRDGACPTLGHGDFGALAALARTAGKLGADALAMSPAHAMFSALPERYSPYSPSSRLCLNVLYASPAAVLGADAVRHAMHDLSMQAARLEDAELIAWPQAAALRLRVLRRLHAQFGQMPRALQARYAAWRQAAGPSLRSHAVFEAMQTEAVERELPPARLPDHPGAHGIQAYADTHAREVDFHLFAQWLADESLRQAQDAARQNGMGIGLIADMAVGSATDGSQVWADPRAYLAGMTVGAPPDLYNPAGQSWGVTSFAPHRLRPTGYRAFLDTLRAGLRHAGGVRIDHILGLSRLWTVPPQAGPADGAYLRYPLDDLLRLAALEAHRHGALIVGENLGTVPEGLNDKLEQRGLLGTEVLWFQRDHPSGRPRKPAVFMPPGRWSAHALAMPTTHDLPTLHGWWHERDIDWRVRLHGVPDAEAAAARQQRAEDRAALWQALQAAGAADPGGPPAQAPVAAMLRFVAQSPGELMLAPLEDLYGLDEQPNIPGTIDEHPNWRRRLPEEPARLAEHVGAMKRVEAIRLGRKRG
ncbi:4-alpha-glucanotransferase [Bordetella ansorpii]|uniref:4-alpha-glucanotransferase n=1 Tax=Bordetella ansorpii TaxID=288768 RepID=A0A157MDB8_9BORD|nr:4-alpha-glucanotransferase [Bordetella ansorpii]SAI06790.1 4-alpha-glucanotransferase [Bordetella ansorpii]